MGKHRNNHCFVPGCKTGYHSQQNKKKISSFKAPKDILERKKWAKIIGRKDRILQERDCVCEKHFHPADVIKVIIINNVIIPYQRPKLKKGAVPITQPDEEAETTLSKFDNLCGGLQSELSEDVHVVKEGEFDSNVQEGNEDYSAEVENDVQEHQRKKVLERENNLARIVAEVPFVDSCNLSSLTEDEQDTINACTVSELKKLMILNRTKNAHVVKLLTKTIECTNRVNRLIWETKQGDVTTDNKTTFRTAAYKLGYPYFKTKEYYACPINPDVHKKKGNHELTRVKPPQTWTAEDLLTLKSTIGLNYSFFRERQIRKQIAALKEIDEDGSVKDADKTKEKIKELSDELLRLQTQEERDMPPLNCEEGIDWYKISDEFKGRHSASECRLFWNLYFHPSINKSNFTAHENHCIKGLVKRYKHQNWDAIAAELGTNRTGYTVCVHYYSKIHNKYRSEKFSPQEDKSLLEVISICRLGNYIPWTKVQQYFPNRSKHQLYHRYRYYLAIDKPINKEPFTVEEDILISCLVNKFGKDFQKVARHVPNRTGMQVKNRYNCYLQNLNYSLGYFTAEEDQKILDSVLMYGHNWSKVAKEMNRNRTAIRHRYWVLKQWQERNPDKRLDEVPHRMMKSSTKLLMFQRAQVQLYADQFKELDTIPTLEMISNAVNKNNKKMKSRAVLKPKPTATKTAHDQLLDYFRTAYTVPTEPQPLVLAEEEVKRSSVLIHNVLKLLNAKLEIPDDTALEQDDNLDPLDVSILKLIRERENVANDEGVASTSSAASTNEERIQYVLPPNVETLLGLRGLILKNSVENPRINEDVDLEEDLRYLDEETRAQVIKERDLFEQRIYALFKWPSILSLTEPNDEIQATFAEEPPQPTQTVIQKKKVGRPSRFVTKNLAKIEKMVRAHRKNKDPNLSVFKPQKPPENNNPTPRIRVKKFAQCEDVPRREGLRPRAQTQTKPAAVTTLKKVDAAEVRKAMQKKKDLKIFVIQNVEIGKNSGASSSAGNHLKKLTVRTYNKKCPSSGVNVGASTSKSTENEPETIVLDDDDEDDDEAESDQVDIMKNEIFLNSYVENEVSDELQNGFCKAEPLEEITMSDQTEHVPLLSDHKCLNTYKRKRKTEADCSVEQRQTKVRVTNDNVKVENEIESLQRDISVLDSIINADKNSS